MVTPKLKTEEMAQFHSKLVKLATLKKEMATIKSELADAESIIKEIGVDEFIQLLEKTGKRETSFNLTSDQGGRVMVIIQDSYKKIDAERAEYLTETYGEDIVKENVEYKFNVNVLERNQEVVANLIENCEDISNDDKNTLIDAVATYSIKKGTIDQLYKLANDMDVSYEVLLEEIQPTVQLKNPQIK
jgi:GGDEF domain-containing protein